MLKVYLDDCRPTPEGWVGALWPEEVIRLLEQGDVSELSLDHDLGDDARGTGYDVLVWLEEAVASRGFRPPRIVVHSANPAASARMVQAIEAIERLALKNELP
ncbi:MAG: cyclic-phosphate processing receiver domain-containing protein [Myxococcales bacterium]